MGRDIFKSLVSVLVQDIPDAPEKEETLEAKGVASLKPKQVPVDPKYEEILTQAMQDRRMKTSADYLGFMESVASLSSIIPDESMRFKAVLQTSKTTTDAVAKSIDYYVGILEKEKKDFNESVKTEKEAKISINKNRITEIDEQLSVLERLQSEKTELLKKIAADETKLDTIKKDYSSAFDAVVARLMSDKTKMEAIK
jgi:hypothetical protein